MAAPGGLGRCVAAFWLALAFDALGLAVLLAGVFADVFFSDLLIYAGGIGIFLSLIWWVFWYAGNLEVPLEELRDDVGLAPPKGRGDSLLRGLVHGLSLRLSSAFGTAPRSRAAAAAAAAELELQRAGGPRGRPADSSRVDTRPFLPSSQLFGSFRFPLRCTITAIGVQPPNSGAGPGPWCEGPAVVRGLGRLPAGSSPAAPPAPG
ncbi:transmembrane protein 238-like [Nyctibius grandis]|uniref:transmembrane protein 238-like n=1 Tax=Nyctibius grandis TaxID=48427 RepID=UPI0035BC4496